MSTLLPETSTGPPEATPIKRDYLSYSAIRAYLQCPLRYYFRYVAQLPEEWVAANLVFGNAIHNAIEFHFRQLLEGHLAPSHAELFQTYKAAWEHPSVPIRFSKDEQPHALDQLAARMLRAFAESAIAQPSGSIVGVEETFREALIPGLPDILGRLDLIVESQDALVVIDWKTSRSRYSAEQVEEAAGQLLLYGEFAREMAPGKEIQLRFGVLTKTKEVNVETHAVMLSPDRISRTKQIITHVWTAIQADHFYPNPSVMNCTGCAYRSACRRWAG